MSLLLFTDTRKKRRGKRKGTARVIRNAVVKTVNVPAARKRKVKTKNETGREKWTATKEMLRLVKYTAH